MITLKQFNLDRHLSYIRKHSRDPIKNGIECPTCGDELLDLEPQMTLASYPPCKKIACESCDFEGYRIA